MKKFTEIDLLNSVKLLNESLDEGNEMGGDDSAELQTMLAGSSQTQPSTPAQSPTLKPPSDDQLHKMLDQAKQPVDMADTAKQPNYERPFNQPSNAPEQGRFSPRPEDAFYNPTFDKEPYKQDFTTSQDEADKSIKMQQSVQGQQNPWEIIRTPNGPRKVTLHPNDKVAEDIERIMQIAKWQG